MNSRIRNIYKKLEQNNLDGLLVSLPSNITYLTEYLSRDSYLLISNKANTYFTDSRYVEEAKKKLKKSVSIAKFDRSVFTGIACACQSLKLKRVGFEERYLPFAEYTAIRKNLPKKISLIPTCRLIEEERQLKTQEEIAKIKKAVNITLSALKFADKFLSPGQKEIEVVAELERFIRYQGASGAAFNIIVASGANSVFPHHIPGQRRIKNNEPVLIDIGADFLGYKSDLTRVFFLGKISVLARKVYDIVSEAQRKAIKRIKPGRPISEIDSAARQYITQKGYGGFFSHNLGHGIGLDVHEEPQISPKTTAVLKPQMVFTVEPAIYLPGKFGVRLEDNILVTKKGCEVLSGVID